MENGWGKSDRFLFWGGGASKITADGDCSHEIKHAWFLEESYDQSRQRIKKQRHYIPNKGPYSQATVFPVVMYGCENWTVKKAEPRRIGAFELWCWRILLRVPWTARRSNQSILKEISPEYAVLNKDWCWSWNSNTWPSDAKNWLTGKDPDAGKHWRWEEKGTIEDEMWIASLARWTGVWVNSGSWWWTVRPGMLQCMGSQRVGLDWATELNQTCRGPCEVLDRVLNKEFTFRGEDRYWTFNKHRYPGSIPGMLGKSEKAADTRKAKG